MKQDMNLSSIKASLFQFLHRYHVIIFVLTAIGGLAIATFMINNVLSAPATDPGIVGNDSFDTKTMDQIRKLRKPGEAAEPLSLPEGRINPFK
jgi:hypothetical protein